jgi:hypothetical protein
VAVGSGTDVSATVGAGVDVAWGAQAARTRTVITSKAKPLRAFIISFLLI